MEGGHCPGLSYAVVAPSSLCRLDGGSKERPVSVTSQREPTREPRPRVQPLHSRFHQTHTHVREIRTFGTLKFISLPECLQMFSQV